MAYTPPLKSNNNASTKANTRASKLDDLKASSGSNFSSTRPTVISSKNSYSSGFSNTSTASTQNQTEFENPQQNMQTDTFNEQDVEIKNDPFESQTSDNLENSENQNDNLQSQDTQENKEYDQNSNYEKQIEDLKLELENSKKEVEDWKYKVLKASADLQNSLKQHDLDISQAKKSTKKYAAQSLHFFINTLYLAFTFAPQTEDEKITKFMATLKSSFDQLIKDLQNQGIEFLLPQIGDNFDANFMNILNPEAASDQEEVTVKQIAGVGLKVDNQVINPVQVMV